MLLSEKTGQLLHFPRATGRAHPLPQPVSAAFRGISTQDLEAWALPELSQGTFGKAYTGREVKLVLEALSWVFLLPGAS